MVIALAMVRLWRSNVFIFSRLSDMTTKRSDCLLSAQEIPSTMRSSAFVVVSATIAMTLGVLPASSARTQSRANAGQPQQAQARAALPDSVEIVMENGQRSRFAVAAIKKATTGPIIRGGMEFDFTPLAAVMKAAGIPTSARIHVTGDSGNELTLQHGAQGALDPEHFGFIFNQRGQPVLTPKPGTPPAASPNTDERPQVRGVVKIEVVRR
jgi:hypothetical protein